MPVQETDILYMGSGTSNLGGAIGSAIGDDVFEAFFDSVLAQETVDGDTEYRCLYIRNNSGDSTLNDAVVYIESQPNAVSSSIHIGKSASAAPGYTEEIIVDEDTAPGSVSAWINPSDAANGLVIGTLGIGEYIGVWVRRTIPIGTGSYVNDQFSLKVTGETA